MLLGAVAVRFLPCFRHASNGGDAGLRKFAILSGLSGSARARTTAGRHKLRTGSSEGISFARSIGRELATERNLNWPTSLRGFQCGPLAG
jgi:hypothetical protein